MSFFGKYLRKSSLLFRLRCPAITANIKRPMLSVVVTDSAAGQDHRRIDRFSNGPARLFRHPTSSVAGGVRSYSTLATDMLMTTMQTPMVNVAFFMVGQMGRVWWQEQTSEVKRKWYARAWALKYALVATGVFAASYVYGQHVRTDPDNGDRRLLLFRDDTIATTADATLHWILYDVGWSLFVLDEEDPTYKRVVRLTNNVLDANREVPGVGDRKCTVIVIDRPEVNASMLPNGTMLMYTGMTKDITDDQLTVVIGHEIGHLIRQHGNQTASVVVVAGALELVADVVLSWTLPIFPAVFTCVVVAAAFNLWLLHFNRLLELEADHDGLLLAARACVDPSESSLFWSTNPDKPTDDRFSWLSSHPSDQVRKRRLLDLLPKAADVRAAAGCDDCGRSYRRRRSDS